MDNDDLKYARSLLLRKRKQSTSWRYGRWIPLWLSVFGLVVTFLLFMLYLHTCKTALAPHKLHAVDQLAMKADIVMAYHMIFYSSVSLSVIVAMICLFMLIFVNTIIKWKHGGYDQWHILEIILNRIDRDGPSA